MATKLDKTIKRELDLEGSLVSGETELRRDLNMSVDAYRE